MEGRCNICGHAVTQLIVRESADRAPDFCCLDCGKLSEETRRARQRAWWAELDEATRGEG